MLKERRRRSKTPIAVDLFVNRLLTEVIVLLTIGWLTTLYGWWYSKRQRWQQRRAWQWWQHRQAIASHNQAESIRDGLLQQTFAFRRYLEMLDMADEQVGAPAQTRQWLARFQVFYRDLESLSNQLSPPFVADSLPLALKFTLSSWQTAQAESAPRPQIELSDETEKIKSGPEQNQVILSMVTTLMTLLIPDGQSADFIRLKLADENGLTVLTLKVEQAGEPTIEQQAELTYLKEIFHSLTVGTLEIIREPSSIAACLSWQRKLTS